MSNELKGYWGKFKKVKGEMLIVWTDKVMTESEMIEWDDTYRHNIKPEQKEIKE